MSSKAKRRPSWKKNLYPVYNPEHREVVNELRRCTDLFRNASKYQKGTKAWAKNMDILFTNMNTW